MRWGERRAPALTLAVALLVALFPLPAGWDDLRLARAAWRAQGVAVTGNSVVRHVSRCDGDRRGLAPLLRDRLGRPVSDLSYPGQTLFASLNAAALALDRPGVTQVVVTLSLPQLEALAVPDLRTQAFFRLAAGDLAVNRILPRLREPATGRPQPQLAAFRYAGRDWPAYDELKTRFMLPERNAARCPEAPARDPRFAAALAWRNTLSEPVAPVLLADLLALDARARRRRKPLLLVMMPLDAGDMPPPLAARAQARADAVVRWARARRLPLLNLTRQLPAAAFADRWCACGHLQAAGRAQVAAAIAATIG